MERGEIGVGLVGYKFMGRAHSNAYRQVASFFEVDPSPRMAAICGRDEAGDGGPVAGEAAAELPEGAHQAISMRGSSHM